MWKIYFYFICKEYKALDNVTSKLIEYVIIFMSLCLSFFLSSFIYSFLYKSFIVIKILSAVIGFCVQIHVYEWALCVSSKHISGSVKMSTSCGTILIWMLIKYWSFSFKISHLERNIFWCECISRNCSHLA